VSLEINEDWKAKKADGFAYATSLGEAYQSSVENFFTSPRYLDLLGKVELIVTSPPFPLVSPKRYGNRVGDAYLEWLSNLALPLSKLLTPTGSIVLEIGNAWVKGEPAMSTLPLETLIEFHKKSELRVNQQFVCHNPSRLPSPAEWVTIRRIRLKDSFTHVWWYSRDGSTKADNRKVLQPYSDSMSRLLKRGSYNTGQRPSDHSIGKSSFLADNGGAIPASMLSFSNTKTSKSYRDWCTSQGLRLHPARMQEGLVKFFIEFLTEPGDIVFDPFGGSVTTGHVAEDSGRKWVVTEPEHEYLLGSIGRFNA
jgi:DNA modification methylase